MEPRYARNTWRYLRLAMVAVVLGLFTAVGIEHFKASHDCFQGSISAYYYTPARGVFVGALVTLAVCLISLRGSTDFEDLLLNVAGMMAPIVAFVPTVGYSQSCTSVSPPVEHASANVANNVVALLIVAGIALLIVNAVLLFIEATLPARLGGVIGVVLWTTTLVVFLSARDFFVHHAHDAAAGLLFVCIVGAAIENARDTQRPTRHALYTGLAAAMGVALVTIELVGHLTKWHYYTIVLEFTVLILFVVFWIVQTQDLWSHGIRPRAQGRREPSPSRRLIGSAAR